MWISRTRTIRRSPGRLPLRYRRIRTRAEGREERVSRNPAQANNSTRSESGSCSGWRIAISGATSRWLPRTRLRRGAARRCGGMKSRALMERRRFSSPARLRQTRARGGCRASPWTRPAISRWAIACPAAACFLLSSIREGCPATLWEPWKAKRRSTRDRAHRQAGSAVGATIPAWRLTLQMTARFGTATSMSRAAATSTGLPGWRRSSFLLAVPRPPTLRWPPRRLRKA